MFWNVVYFNFLYVLYSSEFTALTECHCYGSICCAVRVRILHCCCCLQSDGWKLQNDFQADSQITIIIVVIAAFVCCHLHLQFTLSLFPHPSVLSTLFQLCLPNFHLTRSLSFSPLLFFFLHILIFVWQSLSTQVAGCSLFWMNTAL